MSKNRNSSPIFFDPGPQYDYEHVVIVEHITHLTKSDDGDLTFIHLTNGTILTSSDSIKTLKAKIDSACA